MEEPQKRSSQHRKVEMCRLEHGFSRVKVERALSGGSAQLGTGAKRDPTDQSPTMRP